MKKASTNHDDSAAATCARRPQGKGVAMMSSISCSNNNTYFQCKLTLVALLRPCHSRSSGSFLASLIVVMVSLLLVTPHPLIHATVLTKTPTRTEGTVSGTNSVSASSLSPSFSPSGSASSSLSSTFSVTLSSTVSQSSSEDVSLSKGSGSATSSNTATQTLSSSSSNSEERWSLSRTRRSATPSSSARATRFTIEATVTHLSPSSSQSHSDSIGSASVSSITTSTSVTPSRSAHDLPPWLVGIDGDDLAALPKTILLTSSSPAHFVLRGDDSNGQMTTGAPTLTLRPTPVATNVSGWTQQCREGYAPITGTLSTWNDVSIVYTDLVASLTSSGVASSSITGHITSYLVCTSDGYFSGIVVTVFGDESLSSTTVTFDDGAALPSDGSVSLPATAGQFPSWSIGLMFTLTSSTSVLFSQSVLASFQATTSPVVYVVDASSTCAEDNSLSSFATTTSMNTNNSVLVVSFVIQSSDVEGISAAVSSLQLCVLGSFFLNTTISLWRDVDVNGALVSSASPLRIVAAVASIVSPLQISTSSVNVDALTDALVFCNSLGGTYRNLSLSTVDTPTTAVQTFSMTLPSNVSSGQELSLCLNSPRVPALQGTLVVAIVVIISVSVVDGVSSPAATTSALSPVALFVGSSAPSGVSWVWSFPTTLAIGTFTDITNNMELFIGLRSTNATTTVSPLSSTTSRSSLSATATNTSSAFWVTPADWSSLVDSSGVLAQGAQLLLCWYTAVGSTLVTPIQVALLTFDVTLVRVDSIGTVASPSSTMVAVSGTTNNTVRVSIMSLGTTVPGTNTTSESNGGYRIGTLSSDSATCTLLNTSASYIGTSGAMSGVGSALLLTRLVFSASGTSTGVFCIQRSTTQRSFARTGVFTVVTLASFGNSTNIPQLMEIASGHTSTDRIGATRRYPITLTNMVASVGSDIVTAVTVLPCNSTLQAMIATTLVVDSSDLTTVWLDVAWQSGSVPSTAPSTIALCGWSASASTLEFPSLGVVVRVVPRVVTTSADTILLAGATTAQRFLINFAATRTLSSGLVWVMMPVSSTTATCSGTTTVRFASTLGGFIVNTSSNSTSLSAAMLTSGITGLEPTSSICMGLVNVSSISTSSTTVYVRLPFQAATIVLARYELSGPVNANVSLFPSATPSTSTSSNTVYLYDYELPTLAVQLNMTNASVVTTSSGNSGLTLSLAVSSASSCTSATPIAAWSQGTGSAVDSLPLNISQVLGDIFFLCAKLNTNANPSNTSTYVWTKYYAQVLRMSLLESTMSPVSYATVAELLTVPTSSMASIATMAASARTMTIQGQNLDIPDTMTMNLFIDAGADCLNDVPDLVAPSSATTTTTTRAVFTAPAVSTPLQYLTMCVVMGLHTHPMPVYLGATLRVTGFASIGLPADAVTSRQQGIVAISNFVLNLTVYGPTGSAPLDTSTFQLLASNTSSCGRGITESEVYASFIALPMTTSSSGVTQISMTGLSTAGTYYLCYADASEVFSSTRRTLLELSEWRGAFYNNPRRQSHRRMQTSSSGVASPVGLTITSIDLRISTHTLGTNKSIGSLVNSTLSVPATGSLLSNALLYISATDQTSCTSTLTGTTAYGNSRVPVVFSGCSGSAASATLPAASVVTGSDPMKLCIGIASALDASIVSSSTLTFFDSGLLLAVVEPDALSVSQNQSDSVTYLGTLSTQPIVGMLDGNSGVALSVIPTSTVLQAEWYSVSPVVEATGEVYTLTSSEGDTNFDFSTAPTPVQLRTGKFGYEYMLHFSVPTAASSIAFTPVNSSNTSLDSCTSDLQWAVWYTTTCTTCPTNAYCDGTPVFRVAGSYWRYSEYSPNLYSCGSPYMEDTCTSNTTTGTCVTGHMGPRCSVCEEGYGLGSGYCQECSGNEVLNGFIVFFAALAICIVIVVLVISTLQCKKSDQFPIYFKLLLNHLTQASTLGQFSENLSSALTTLFKIQRQVSRPSPAFAALTCTFGTDWYGQFIMVIAFPGVIAALLIIFFTVKQIVSDYGERRRLGLSTTVTREGFRKSIAATDEGSTKHRRKTVMFFAPKHSIDESLDIDGVEKTNSIAIMDLSNDNALLKSQISNDGRPPLRKKRAQSAAEGDQSGNTPGVDDAHQPRESPPSVPLAPLDPPREAMEGEDADEERPARHQQPTPTAFALDDDDADISGSNVQRKSSSRGTQLTQQSAIAVSIKDVGMLVTSVDAVPADHEDDNVISKPAEDDDDEDLNEEDFDEHYQSKKRGGLERKNTELGLLEVHRSVAKAKARHLFMVVMIIVMFAAYPSILEWCANVLRCDDIDIGEVQTDGTTASRVVEYFYYDRSKYCTSSEHKRYTAAGISLGCIYGFGTPICAVLLYLRLKRPKSAGGVGFIDASRMFTFLIAGYRREVWWWEAAVMFRKMILIYITAFLTDSQQQTLCAFWAICFYLLAHEVVRPYEYDTVDRMERYSLIVICLTLNFSMAYPWLVAQDTTAKEFGYWCVSVFLLIINILVVAWMLHQIIVEGTIKVRKFIFLHSAEIKEKFPPRMSECILQLAYRPPEMVEVLPDGNIVEVPVQDIPNISVEEHQAFLDAEESGSDWSDEEEFLIEEEEAAAADGSGYIDVEGHVGDRDAAVGRSTEDDQQQQQSHLQASNLHPGVIATSGASTPNRDGGLHMSGGGQIIGRLRSRLKSISNMFGLRARGGGAPAAASHGPHPHVPGGAGLLFQRSVGHITSPTLSAHYQQQQHGNHFAANLSLNSSAVTPDVATIAAQDALAQLESAFTARNHNTVAQLRAIIDGMQTHSDALIAKYATLKQNLQTKTEELEECKKHRQAQKAATSKSAGVNEKDMREHVNRLADLEEMAEALRQENESLKDQLQMAQTTYSPRSQSPSNQRLVDALRAEREELLRRLAEHEMAFRGAMESSGRGGGEDGFTATAKSGVSVDQRLRELEQKAEEEEAAANALADAERETQMRMIQEQLNAKRMARMQRSTNNGGGPSNATSDIGAAPTAELPPTTSRRVHRKSVINTLVDKITEEDDFTDDDPPNPFRSTISPRESVTVDLLSDASGMVGHGIPARPSSRMGMLAERLENAMRNALVRTGTQRSLFGSPSGQNLLPMASLRQNMSHQQQQQPVMQQQVAPMEALGLSAAFPEENFTAAPPDEEGRVLVIKRRHPKMRPPEFLAPWGHATWSKNKHQK